MEKYYIPKIEEFHVGFECFMRDFTIMENGKPNQEVWRKRTLSDFEQYDDWDIPFQLSGNKLRVKYLDRYDIESLGWQHDQTTKDAATFYIGSIITEKMWMLNCDNAILRKGNDYTTLSIADVNDKYKLGCSFSGKIKNISEFRRLMTQLGIDKKE